MGSYEKAIQGAFAVVCGLMAVIIGWGNPEFTGVEAGMTIAIIGGAWVVIGIIGMIINKKS